MEFNATLLISTISFIIFTLIMNKILYAPMSRIVEKRRLYLEQNSITVEKNQNEADAIIEDKNNKIMNAKKQSKEEIAEEMEKNKKSKLKVTQDKKIELSRKIEDHKDELKNEKNNLSGELENCVQGISDTILEQVMMSERGKKK